MPLNWIVVSVVCFVWVVSGQSTSDGPLNFTHDRTDGRLVWITNRTGESIQKIQYRRLSRDANHVLVSSINMAWQQMSYDPRSPVWQIPDGICSEYEFNVTTIDGKSFTQVLEAPLPTFKTSAKPKVARIFFDPIRNRIMAEVAWTNDFDYYTAAGAVLIDTVPWIRHSGCQSLFKQVTPPPSLEGGVSNRGALFSFDPEYAKNNCTFIFGVNGTLKMMQTPPIGQGLFRGGPQLITNGQLIQLPINGGPIIQGSNQVPIVQGSFQNQGRFQGQGFPQFPVQGPFPGQGPFQNGQFIQRQESNDQCDKINFISALSNDTLTLNLTCETVTDSFSLCVPPTRQCRLACSPLDIRAYNMQDNGEYLKIDWQFPDNLQQEIRRYQVRYAEANVTPWNTVLLEKQPTEVSVDTGKNYVEIRSSSGPGTNFTFQICANLGQICNASIQWDQERKYAIGYTAKSAVAANLVYAESTPANSRRKGKGTGVSHMRSGSAFQVFLMGFIATKLLL